MIENVTMAGAMAQIELAHEDGLFANLTNNRKIEGSKVDKRRTQVLKGHQKIMNFIARLNVRSNV